LPIWHWHFFIGRRQCAPTKPDGGCRYIWLGCGGGGGGGSSPEQNQTVVEIREFARNMTAARAQQFVIVIPPPKQCSISPAGPDGLMTVRSLNSRRFDGRARRRQRLQTALVRAGGL
jgi:hypothetical protein